MNNFPAQGTVPQNDPQYWNPMYGGRGNPFDTMRQQQRISAIPGRMVQAENNIRPNDVPMDGSVALFPLQDMSCIYGKAWNTDGQIITVRYVPDQPQQPAQAEGAKEDPFAQVNSRLDGIEATLQKLLNPESTETVAEKKGGAKK